MARDLTNGIEEAFAERIDLLVVALTGRTGSGCSTTAQAMTRAFNQIPTAPDAFSGAEKRKQAICAQFAAKQWIPFKAISVSTVIFGLLILEDWTRIESFLRKQRLDTQISSLKEIYDELRADVNFSHFDLLAREHRIDSAVGAWEFYVSVLTVAAGRMRAALGNKYPPLFQTLGDNLRISGCPLDRDINPKKIFSLIVLVKRLAKAAGKWDRSRNIHSTRIVIDAVRNPLELVYLRDQFAAFFAIAITADEEDRLSRLSDQGMKKKEIETLDTREYSKKSLSSYENFVSQNLQECIQKSDLFFHNPGKPAAFEQNKLVIHGQVIRYVALMLRPGLVTPTSDERCMQLAFVAKLNSGCISRQVGAAVADSNSSIKAIGWNDVPKGQIPCLLRDVEVLLNSNDADAFSDYEKNDKALRVHLAKRFENANAMKTARGLPCPFCFKDAYNTVTGDKNQVHTRSLHAEENAFLQLAKYGNSGINGGSLYTTASPCELCSKKAFQLGMREIIYVDPYPGISSTHVLKSGTASNRPSLRLFSGAIGNAYHRLYEPVLPIKDEYFARLADDPEPVLL